MKKTQKKSTGRKNVLTKQIGEYLTCAELGRRGLIATTFTGNVPGYDLLVCDGHHRALPIQIKTSTSNSWRSNIHEWLNIEIDHSLKKQINKGPRKLDDPDLIYVCVALGKEGSRDRFFICLRSDIQKICIDSYAQYMEPIGWRRPRKYESPDNRYAIKPYLVRFEDNWDLINKRLKEGVRR